MSALYHLKKYFKEILVVLTIALCAFFFVSNSLVIKEKEVVSKTLNVNQLKEESPILIERYPEASTKKVRLKLDSLLKRINKRHDFHGALLVAKNEKVLYHNQVGLADFQKKIPLTKESVFQLASVSKQFTAAAIMLLHEREKIRLSDTINTYFPDFPYENVTIQNLLNHTGGLPKYFWLAEHKWHQSWAPRNSEMMALLESSNVQRFYRPGQKFDYSNTGYFVLASIVEKVTGSTFATFVRSNIFEPLQMNDSYVYSFENDSIKENQLVGYRLYRGSRHLKIGSTVNDAIVGDKNVYTTIEDLFKWTIGLNTGRLLTKESLNLMYSKGETIYGKEIPYGFGFRIDTNKQKSIYHHGRWNGFSTGLTKYLDDDLVVIVLEHTSFNSMKALNKTIKGIVVDNLKV
ncbi:serine hydrolase [uncultured Algibacter sp.]|uniref:serine hydrolase domain-containing protein n=1 Tax=uncultured Algibacter sp. TaxID=298659 RepID=UPI00262E2A5B|nr:serine hydrolase domain-containing protein [uncultured Algibacter sp.]